ncbi:hypothetical protein [Lactovum odontotermitis]
MRELISNVLSILGLVAICAAGFSIVFWLGLMLTGFSLILIAYFTERGE